MGTKKKTTNDAEMIKKEDYNEILSRIKHIKSLFAFGEGILPFLEELFVFLKEVTPLLNEVSSNIMNTTGMMPDAAFELDSAVEETSDATYRIMESVEQILVLLDEYQEKTKDIKELENVDSPVDEIRAKSMAIMNALQFHDIVSQKLVHVRKVLGEVQQRMLALFTRVYDLDIDSDVKENILSTLGVNVDEFERIMETKIEQQNRLTDDSTGPRKEEKETPTPSAAKFDQSDIDDLFG